MKPDWKDAPEWANWLAADRYDGLWYWYEKKPVQKLYYWAAENEFDRWLRAGTSSDKWRGSLEQRPEVKDD